MGKLPTWCRPFLAFLSAAAAATVAAHNGNRENKALLRSEHMRANDADDSLASNRIPDWSVLVGTACGKDEAFCRHAAYGMSWKVNNRTKRVRQMLESFNSRFEGIIASDAQTDNLPEAEVYDHAGEECDPNTELCSNEWCSEHTQRCIFQTFAAAREAHRDVQEIYRKLGYLEKVLAQVADQESHIVLTMNQFSKSLQKLTSDAEGRIAKDTTLVREMARPAKGGKTSEDKIFATKDVAVGHIPANEADVLGLPSSEDNVQDDREATGANSASATPLAGPETPSQLLEQLAYVGSTGGRGQSDEDPDEDEK